jgi:hypothetical protein
VPPHRATPEGKASQYRVAALAQPERAQTLVPPTKRLREALSREAFQNPRGKHRIHDTIFKFLSPFPTNKGIGIFTWRQLDYAHDQIILQQRIERPLGGLGTGRV